MLTHKEAKDLKRAIDGIQIKISTLLEEKFEKQNYLLTECPHLYSVEWTDHADNIWSQCSLCEGDIKIIGKVKTTEERIYNAE